MVRKRATDPRLITPNAYMIAQLGGLKEDDYKELTRRQFESSVCEQYCRASRLTVKALQRLQDTDGFLTMGSVSFPGDCVTALHYDRVSSWDEIDRMSAETIIRKYCDSHLSGMVVINGGTGTYRGIAICKSPNLKLQDIHGRAIVLQYRSLGDRFFDSRMLIMRPYDMFHTLIGTGHMPACVAPVEEDHVSDN